jgi:hypothetical protein
MRSWSALEGRHLEHLQQPLFYPLRFRVSQARHAVKDAVDEVLVRLRFRGQGRALGSGDVTTRGFSQFKNDVDRLTRSIFSRSPAPAPNGSAVWHVLYWKLHNAVARHRQGDD